MAGKRGGTVCYFKPRADVEASPMRAYNRLLLPPVMSLTMVMLVEALRNGLKAIANQKSTVSDKLATSCVKSVNRSGQDF